MSDPTPSDIEAARKLLGGKGMTHEHVRDLPGARNCPHELAGSGEDIDDLVKRVGLLGTLTDNKAILQSYRQAPYRHHGFVPGIIRGPGGDEAKYCKCGNPAQSLAHAVCRIGGVTLDQQGIRVNSGEL